MVPFPSSSLPFLLHPFTSFLLLHPIFLPPLPSLLPSSISLLPLSFLRPLSILPLYILHSFFPHTLSLLPLFFLPPLSLLPLFFPPTHSLFPPLLPSCLPFFLPSSPFPPFFLPPSSSSFPLPVTWLCWPTCPPTSWAESELMSTLVYDSSCCSISRFTPVRPLLRRAASHRSVNCICSTRHRI